MTSYPLFKLKNVLPKRLTDLLCTTFPNIESAAILSDIIVLNQYDSLSVINKHLTEKEKKAINSFSLPKRKNEYISGRLCGKTLLRSLLKKQNLNLCPTEISILNEESGRPKIQLETKDDRAKGGEFDISITHSLDFGGALLSTHFCGFDVQEEKETLQRVQEKFCLEQEKRIVVEAGAPKNLTALNLIWSAKEAIRKMLSSQFLPDFLAIKVEKTNFIYPDCAIIHCSVRNEYFPVVCGIYQNYSISLCINQKKKYA